MVLQEIDRKQIKLIESRFTGLSNSRLEKMLASFNLTQSDAIKLLPLLFHVNHPMLPGYVDKSTPCGIPSYTPTALEKKIAKTVSRSFKYQSRAYLRYQVVALYLMGSTGTLAQSIRSDLDLWVCIDQKLENSARQKLQQKTRLISQWMAERGVELNCYIVHQQDFTGNTSKHLSKESCGDTQNYLLLDEFYRTALWLAGRKPLWWIVPVHENYPDYSKRLLAQKFVSWADWIDFGEVVDIPPAEYFSASLWQLFKSIESPYKSCLKLLLLEIYARHVSQTGLLSEQFKLLVYQGEYDLAHFDPYVFMFDYAAKFLQQQPQRLEFLRRAFYLKSGTKVQLGSNYRSHWRHLTLQKMVKQWGWNQSRLDYLNQRSRWQMNRVLKEREELVRELNHSYHFLANFARAQGVEDQVSQNELLSLGRKLYSVFEKRAGKVEVVNTGIVKDLVESSITLYEKSDAEWYLFLGATNKAQLAVNQPVYSADTVFMLIAWCVCNQVANRNTVFQVFSDNPYITHAHVQQLARQLTKLRSNKESSVTDESFLHPSMTEKVGVFFNTESDPLAKEKQLGIYNVTDQSDHFCWGEEQLNLVPQFETFVTNSWGENICKRYIGDEGWVQFFIDNREIMAEVDEKLFIFFDGLPAQTRLRERLTELLSEWSKLVIDNLKKQKEFRYLMTIGKRFLKIEFIHGQVLVEIFNQPKLLLDSLSQQSSDEFEYVLDEYLNLSDIVKRVIRKPADKNINCYIIKKSSHKFDVLVKDCKGHIFYQRYQRTREKHLVSYYHQFID
ncbi:MAG: class I adenylate cyclase, partial [Kangiellaceae bacterium]|nr:class I adenylate cyclase [Kangiellaceae bacterium]